MLGREATSIFFLFFLKEPSLPPQTSSGEYQEHQEDISTNAYARNKEYNACCLLSIFSTFYGSDISHISFLFTDKYTSTRYASRNRIARSGRWHGDGFVVVFF